MILGKKPTFRIAEVRGRQFVAHEIGQDIDCEAAREHIGLRAAFGRVGERHEGAAMVAVQGH